ncbi:MAG: nickel-responsive transcriptional regulator NikR [bacterium]|nr:nickel-responsive transcriptional regulator NikR [bacterium]
MADLIRFGISMDAKLLERFDAFLAEHGYGNRSEGIRDLVRDRLVQEEWKDEREETVGTVTLVYDHHQRELTEKLTGLQHRWHGQILSAMHIHLDEHHCLEVLAVRGRASTLKKIADTLLAARGVKHGKLVMTSTGKNI